MLSHDPFDIRRRHLYAGLDRHPVLDRVQPVDAIASIRCSWALHKLGVKDAIAVLIALEFHTDGETDVQLVHGGVNGDRELLKYVRNGIFQMTAMTDCALFLLYPKVQLFSIPNLYCSANAAITYMNTSPEMVVS